MFVKNVVDGVVRVDILKYDDEMYLTRPLAGVFQNCSFSLLLPNYVTSMD